LIPALVLTARPSLAAIDWQALWWQPWRELGQSVGAHVGAGAAVHEALNAVAQTLSSPSLSHPVNFVPQSALPEGRAYEAFIFETKTVPTRDNLHDFFNGLAWLRYPAIKARLNALQYNEISSHGVQPLRGALRDALTLFDENAAFLSSDVHAPIIAALRQRDWQAAFHTHRSLLSKYPPLLFGHALLEKLVSPYKSITAHVFPAQYAIDLVADGGHPESWGALDTALASQLSAESLLPKPYVPLPVLGVPLWWEANESPDFYADSTVFRAPRA
jgi:hypothetical protein